MPENGNTRERLTDSHCAELHQKVALLEQSVRDIRHDLEDIEKLNSSILTLNVEITRLRGQIEGSKWILIFMVTLGTMIAAIVFGFLDHLKGLSK